MLFDLFTGDNAVLLSQVIEDIQDKLPLQAVNLSNLLADRARNIWKEEAIDSSPWGRKYADSIEMRPATPNTNAIVYIDESKIDTKSGRPFFMFSMMVEEGVRSWSIKDALLQSDKVKTSKNGLRYIIVPFRWGTPKRKESGKSAAQMQNRVMPDDVYKIVKGGSPLKGDHGYITGLKKYNKNNHSHYMTFRMVSEKSDGWQHPGRPATPVFDRVKQHVENMINATLKQYVEALVHEYNH